MDTITLYILDDRRSGSRHVVAIHASSLRRGRMWNWCPERDVDVFAHLFNRNEMKLFIGSGRKNQGIASHFTSKYLYQPENSLSCLV